MVANEICRSLNNGSAHNVWAGAYINLDKVIAHYEKINYEDNARKLKAMEDGTLKPVNN